MRQKAFTRQCASCRCHKNKDELIRFVILNNNVVIDESQKLSGRGIYLCKNEECINNAKKKNLVNKGIKFSGSLDIYDEALKKVNNEH